MNEEQIRLLCVHKRTYSILIEDQSDDFYRSTRMAFVFISAEPARRREIIVFFGTDSTHKIARKNCLFAIRFQRRPRRLFTNEQIIKSHNLLFGTILHTLCIIESISQYDEHMRSGNIPLCLCSGPFVYNSFPKGRPRRTAKGAWPGGILGKC